MSADIAKYLKNRASFPVEELAKHRGEWIAWSQDGLRIVASSRDPDEIDRLIVAAGEDPEQCIVEAIPESDSVVGSVQSP